MRNILVFCLTITLNTHALFSYFNERHYAGIDSSWKHQESVESHLEIMSQFLPENPTVFEVGAKDGEDSVRLAKMWPKGSIISFEANPNQFKRYQEKALDFENMHGYNLAVNTYNGFATFYLCWGSNGNDPVFEGASSLLMPSEAYKHDYQGPMISVPCVILDDWCRENGVEAIDFMWLDIEGFELQFMKSSPSILKTVKVIQTETNLREFRVGTTQFTTLKRFLESQGFKMVAHWYNESLQGDAIFVRKELLKNRRR